MVSFPYLIDLLTLWGGCAGRAVLRYSDCAQRNGNGRPIASRPSCLFSLRDGDVFLGNKGMVALSYRTIYGLFMVSAASRRLGDFEGS